MTFKVIDISSHQSVEVAGIDGIDAVIVKATQDVTYINPKCDAQYQLAKQKGRGLGVYHYAGGGDPVAEADFFLKNIEGYIGEAVLALDWESGQNSSWGDSSWCRKFVNRVHEKTGIWCLIYIQASALNQVSNCANDCGLWIAGYPTNDASWDVPAFNYSTSPWSTYTLWQFTSGGALDRNVGQINRAAWDRIAKGESAKQPEPVVVVENPTVFPEGKVLSTLVLETAQGFYGNGDARKSRLGKYYNSVQAIIDNDGVIETLTMETVAGKFGVGEERRNFLGGYYNQVQAAINALTGNATRYYTVKQGESLSGIASGMGLRWQDLASKNGIYPPYTIFPGNKLKY